MIAFLLVVLASLSYTPSNGAATERSTISRTTTLHANSDILSRFAVANETQQAGQTQKAMKAYQDLITIVENSQGVDRLFSEAYNNLGYVYLEQSKTQKARQAFKKAIETSKERFQQFGIPLNSTPLINLALIHLQEGKLDEAGNLAEDVLNEEPDNTRALMARGIQFKRIGSMGIRAAGDRAGHPSPSQLMNCRVSCHALREACDDDPQKCKERDRLCSQCTSEKTVGQQEAIDRAILFLEEANELEQDPLLKSEIITHLGFTHALSGNTQGRDSAIELALQAKSFAPNAAFPYALSGYLNQHFRRETLPYKTGPLSLTNAIRDYKKGISLAKDDKILRSLFYYNLASIYAVQGQGMAIRDASQKNEGLSFFYLRKAVADGYCDLKHMRLDPDFHHLSFIKNTEGQSTWHSFVDSLQKTVKKPCSPIE